MATKPSPARPEKLSFDAYGAHFQVIGYEPDSTATAKPLQNPA